jgi:hypothetical protein
MCVPASQKSHSSGERSLQQHQERGASAPRGAAALECNGDQHTLSGVLRIIALVSAQACFHTHGGLTCVQLDGSARNCNGVTHTHGGLTCAALDEIARNCSGVTHSHGGLTPAALVNVRFCIAKGVIFTENEHRSLHQERGTSAPRGFATATAPAFVGTAMVVCRDFAAAYLQVHFPNSHGGLTPAALVGVRFCIAKGVIFTENEHRSLHQERGA